MKTPGPPLFQSSDPLVIEGDFKPAKRPKALRIAVKLMGLLLVLLAVGALAIYGVNVHFVTEINEVSKRTRDINEANKELQVRLNRIRAFKNIEVSAAKVSHLKPPSEMLEVSWPSVLKSKDALLTLPENEGEQPRVYGY